MTDKVQKIREEVARMQLYTQSEVLKQVLDYIDEMQKEEIPPKFPLISQKKCMYTKDSYTDEDRKVLCDGCEEDCKYAQKEEPVSEALKTELEKYIKDHFTIDTEQLDRFGIEEKDYMYSMDKSDMFALVEHFTNWQKAKMMANGIDVEVKVDAGGYPYIDRTIELYDYDKDQPLAKKGDKVKVIVIKED